MNFKIVGTNELCQKILNFIDTNEVKTDAYNKEEIKALPELMEKLASDNTEMKQRSIITFEEVFFRLYSGTIDENKSFFREVSAISGAIFAKKELGDEVTLLDECYTTLDDLPDGTLFVWCDEPMFIVGGNTYTITKAFHYKSFTYFEREPAYILGIVSEDVVNDIFTNWQ